MHDIRASLIAGHERGAVSIVQIAKLCTLALLKRLRSFVLAVVVVMAVAYCIGCVFTYREVKAFRVHPAEVSGRRLALKNGVLSPVRRRLMLVAGRPSYNRIIWDIFATPPVAADTIWSKHLIRLAASRLTDETLSGMVSANQQIAALAVKARLVAAIREHGLSDNELHLIGELSQRRATQELAWRLALSGLAVSKSPEVDLSLIQAIAPNPRADYSVLFAINPDIASWFVVVEPSRHEDSRYAFVEDEDEDEDEDESLEPVPVPSSAANTLWHELSTHLAPTAKEWRNVGPFCESLMESGTPDQRRSVLSFVTAHASELPGSFIVSCATSVPTHAARELASLYETAVRLKLEAAERIFHHLASLNLVLAEHEFEWTLKSTKDPSDLKDLIVILANHDSALASRYIDFVFVGKRPRTERFSSLSTLAYGPKATREYESLAKHGYLETGKSFPPAYSRGEPRDDEATTLMQFALQYPWYPAADDAMYRSAYAHYRARHYARAWQTLVTITSKRIYDGDTSEVVRFLAEAIAQDVYRKFTRKDVPPVLSAAWSLGQAMRIPHRAIFDRDYTAGDCRRDASAYADPTVLVVTGLSIPMKDIDDLCVALVKGGAQQLPAMADNEEIAETGVKLWVQTPPGRVSTYVASVDRDVNGQPELIGLLSDLTRSLKAKLLMPKPRSNTQSIRFFAGYLSFFLPGLQSETDPPSRPWLSGDDGSSIPSLTQVDSSYWAGHRATGDKMAQTLLQVRFDASEQLNQARERLGLGANESFVSSEPAEESDDSGVDNP